MASSMPCTATIPVCARLRVGPVAAQLPGRRGWRTPLGGLQQLPIRPAFRVRRRQCCTKTTASSSNGAGPNQPAPGAEDSDVVFVLKLAVVSFALGAIIKYGSLWLDAPFDPNPALALTFVVTPPLGYAAYLLLFRQGHQQQ